MAPKKFYSGSVRGVHFRRIFTPGLVCFAMLMIIFSQSVNSSPVVWNKTEAHVCLKPGQKLLEIHKHLRALNKPAVKSIQSPDGDIIDCILLYKQIAFDDPLLRNHTIQEFPTIPSGIPLSSMGNTTLKRPFQIWHFTGVGCPKGTIPVRRTSSEDLMRLQSAVSHGKKVHGFHDGSSIIEKPELGNARREYAIVVVEGDRYYGSSMNSNLWNPKLSSPEEISLAQMWIGAGRDADRYLNTIEVGWQVHPPLYGDHRTRIFVYWTGDGYRTTGCYNLLCTGFIQTNDKVCLGGSVNTISSYEGTQHEVLFIIWKENQNGNWWLILKDYGRVGYWPSRIFTVLATHATTVQWGGEVGYYSIQGEHTTVEMGSGHFAGERFGRASYMRNLRTLNTSYIFEKVRTWNPYVSAPNCYSLSARRDDLAKGRFYFGGPGHSPVCF